MSLTVGDLAPDFSLPDAEGNQMSLAAFKGRRVVLYFYPRDNTPGCTQEACALRDAYDTYQGKDVVVLGVSTDDVIEPDGQLEKIYRKVKPEAHVSQVLADVEALASPS